MAVRSRKFFDPIAVTGAAPVGLYTVPAGRTAVFRAIRVVSVGGGTLYVAINTFSLSTITVGANGTGSALLGGEEWVLNPGDVLSAQVLLPAQAFRVFGSGSLLLGAPS